MPGNRLRAWCLRSETADTRVASHSMSGDPLALAVLGHGLVDPRRPWLRADDEAVLRGRAAFETLRVYGGGPFPPAQHPPPPGPPAPLPPPGAAGAARRRAGLRGGPAGPR